MRSLSATRRNIYVRSQAAGERVMASVVAFLESKLRLKVNAQKSAVAPVMERAFLGHRLLFDGRIGIAPNARWWERGKPQGIPLLDCVSDCSGRSTDQQSASQARHGSTSA